MSKRDPLPVSDPRGDFDLMRRWRVHMPLVLLGLLGGISPTYAAGVKTRAVRYNHKEGVSRLVIEFSALPTYSTLLLTAPLRLVIDLEGVEPEGELQSMGARVLPPDLWVAALRAGRNRPGVTRIVIELKAPVDAAVFVLPPQGELAHRLVIELREKGTAPRLATTLPGSEKSPAKVPVKEPSKDTAVAPEHPVPVTRQVIVAIDPGHGGQDPGAVGAKGTREKDITLAVARRLRQYLEETGRVRCVLTRDDDIYLSLHERVQLAREATADLFISVHADAFNKRTARGSTVFALSEHGASSAFAKYMAKRENQADLIGNAKFFPRDVFQMITDGSFGHQIRDSLAFARGVIAEVSTATIMHSILPERAPFAVLKAPNIPSILIETGFVSNLQEERLLKERTFQEKMAKSIMAGVQRYIETKDLPHQPPNVWIDRKKDKA